MRRIGIFAGTFDPIHEGHLAFAEAALATRLEKVMFLVEPRPRRKQGVRSLEHRVAMVQLAIADNPRLGTIVLEQARFSVHETLPVLQARFMGYQLVLLFGDDVISHIAGWPHVEELIASTRLLIVNRHHQADILAAAIKTLEKTRSLKFVYDTIEPPATHIASSKIRLDLKRGLPPTGLAPAVADYIHQHSLYGSSGNNT